MLTLMLAAAAGVVTPTAARFECGGRSMVAQFTNGRAIVTLGDRQWRLAQVASTLPEARYEGGTTRQPVRLLVGEQGSALSIGRRTLPQCRRADPPVVAPGTTR